MKAPLPAHILFPGFALLVMCCAENPEEKRIHGGAPGKPVIAAANYPLAYFAGRLADDFAIVLFDVPPDEDPAFWEPTDAQVRSIQEADLILLNGATYAKWATTRTLPYEETVITTGPFDDKLIRIEGSSRHTHRKDAEAHSHDGLAFTPWLDFTQASTQATEIALALGEKFPGRKETVMHRLESLQKDLADLDTTMAAASSKLQNAPVIVSHPVYQYWARAYDIVAPSLLWEPGLEISSDDMAALTGIQKKHPGAKYFIWEDTPLPQNIAKLKNAGLTSIVISPCGNRPETGDFLSIMRANISALEALPD